MVVLVLIQAKDVRHAELAERFLGSTQTSSIIHHHTFPVKKMGASHPWISGRSQEGGAMSVRSTCSLADPDRPLFPSVP